MEFRRATPQRSSSRISQTTTRIAAPTRVRSPNFHLQKAIGNSAVSRLFKSDCIQPKLNVSEPDDEYEREADRVADQVMRMPEPQSHTAVPHHTPPLIQRACNECEDESVEESSVMFSHAPVQVSRKCNECEIADEHDTDGDVQSQTQAHEEEEKEEEKEEEDERQIRTKRAAGDPPEISGSVESILRNSRHDGSPLPGSLRDFFEPRFGADLGGVRLHQNAQSAEMADQLNARAFTVGKDVFFGEDEYKPTTDDGQRLIAHELTHTLQQSDAQQRSATVGTQPPLLTPRTPASGPDTVQSRIESAVPATGAVLPPTALSFIIPVFRMPLVAPMIQRRARVSLAPPGLPCILTDVAGTPGELSLMFGHDEALLNAGNLGLIENYLGVWVSRGLSPDLTISGYASTDGSQRHNWRLSCERAAAVQTELVRLGVPSDKTTIFAHGETNDFDTTSLEPNRRATIESTAGTGPVITPVLTPHDPFAGRSLTRFGLSELVDIDHAATPSIAAAEHFGVQWMVVSPTTGTVLGRPGPDLYTASNVPVTEQLALLVMAGPAVGTQLLVINLSVIAPVTAYMVQSPGSGLCHTNGEASVGFRGDVFMLPTDVSFNRIQWREGTAPAIATGSLSAHDGIPHAIGNLMSIGTGNTATGCQVNTVDSVDSGRATPSTFFGLSPDWAGTFTWPIPWEYQAPGGAIIPFTIATHVVVIDSAGTAVISKAGAGPFSRAIGDSTSCVASVGGLPPHCCP